MDFFFLCRPAAYPKWGVVTAVSYFHGFLTQAAGWDSASDETHEQKLIAACYRQNTRGAMIQPLTVFQWVSVVLLSCHPVSCFIYDPTPHSLSMGEWGLALLSPSVLLHFEAHDLLQP